MLNIKKPLSVAIETTNLCNAKCSFCPNKDLNRKKGIMSSELFKKIINDCKDFQPKYILPILNGEPFLDPNIINRIKLINEEIPTARVMLFTNANLMTPQISDQLFNLNIHMITFSINAVDSKKYIQRMKLNYETTIENINYFIKHNNVPNLKFSMVAQDASENEISEFKKLWGKDAFVAKYANYSGSMYNTQSINYPCKRALREINILYNGEVSLCCRDMEGKMIFGDANKDHLLNIWNNKKMKELRSFHLNDKRNQYPLCNNCNEV